MVVPSMLNLTSVKINLERGQKNSTRFAMGVGFAVLFQAYLAVSLMEHINNNPEVLMYIKSVATIIFGGLSVYFFRNAGHGAVKNSETKQDCRNTFVIGLLLSGMNMFAIPFYYGVVSLLNHLDLLLLDKQHIFLFVIGSAIGSFLILYVYPLVFKRIAKVKKYPSTTFNLILGSITAVLTVISIYQLV